jgi:probable F420-dependent oxidoreductase
MKVHVMTGASRLQDFQAMANRAEAAGFSGLVVTESGRTAYLVCAAAALSGADLDLATGVAVAFPRSPMVTASTAWELAEATGGRFRLGIGTQVRAHIERRYGAAFDRPGPRLREYVLALRAIFAAFRGAPLDFHGEFHDLTLLPAMWSPGAIGVPDPPVDVAAVNPWMLRMAGEVADGVHIHPLNTPTYLAETVLPNVAAGVARRADPDAARTALFLPLFTVVGDTAEERNRWREVSRSMVSFYGSTPNYGFIFEQIGFPGTTERLRERQKAGDIGGMAAVITDDILVHFAVEGTWDELPGRIVDRCQGLGDHDVNVVLYSAGGTAAQPGDTFEKFGAAAREVIAAG